MASTSSAAAASGSGTGNSGSAAVSTRLYVGNLHYSVDEYSLIKIFSRFGKVTKMDFLFHKTGEQRGKPRGYAFVELGTPADAQKAVNKLHDHPLRGRNLVVTYASQMRQDAGTGGKNSSSMGDRRTTLSMVKGAGKKPQGASAQIAALEAKLAQMKKSAPTDDPLQEGDAPRLVAGFSSSGIRTPLSSSTAPASPAAAGVDLSKAAGAGEDAGSSASETTAAAPAPPAPKAPSAAFTAGLASLPPRPRGV